MAAHLKEIVLSHQGKIATSPQKATHIISDKYDVDPNEDPDKEYLRTIDHNNKMNLVHWWYYPDSYDTWLPATDVEGEQPDPDPPHHGVWKVSPRFLTDLEIFNEWMNELDYEIEEDEEQEQEGGRGGRGGRGKGKKGSRKRNSEDEEGRGGEAKKAKTKGKKYNGDEEEVDVEGEEEGRGKKVSSNPSTPIGTPKDKKLKKDEQNGDGFKIKISRDATENNNQPNSVPLIRIARSNKDAYEIKREGEEGKMDGDAHMDEDIEEGEQPAPAAIVAKVPDVPIPIASVPPARIPQSPQLASSPYPQMPLPVGLPNPGLPYAGAPMVGVSPGMAAAGKFPGSPAPMAGGYPQPVPTAFNPQAQRPMPATPLLRSNVTRVTPVPSSAKRLDNPGSVSNISQLTPAQAGYPSNAYAPGQPAQPAQPPGPPVPATPELAIAPGAKVDTTSVIPTPVPFPAHCSWFNMSEIHETEKTSLPEFFSGKFPSKTPAVYKEYRDFMINTYIQNPQVYLTQTACRRNLTGDVCAILRVHQFLEHWGLINYHVAPDTGGFIPIPPSAAQASTGPGADPRTSFYQFVGAEKEKANKIKQQGTQKGALRHNLFGQASPHVTCTNCSAVAKTRYQAKASPITLCPKCFADGHFPESLSSGDFIHCSEPVSSLMGRSNTVEQWTDQETLLLLEGIELYNENWDQISEHVGSKTKEQCLLHFIRLPVEDSFIENHFFEASDQNGAPPAKISSASETNENDMEVEATTPVKEEPQATLSNHTEQLLTKSTPFSSASNPLMMMVAFLASSVNPVVASAAAQAALESLTKKEGTKEGDTTDPEKAKEEATGLTKQGLQTATAAALSAAVLKSKLFAEKEEREIQGLVMKVISLELKKLELKLKHFSEIEETLDRERMQIDKARQTLYQEKQAIITAKLQLLQQAQQAQLPHIVEVLNAPPQINRPLPPPNFAQQPQVPTQQQPMLTPQVQQLQHQQQMEQIQQLQHLQQLQQQQQQLLQQQQQQQQQQIPPFPQQQQQQPTGVPPPRMTFSSPLQNPSPHSFS
eukprot:Phypoly_transcript_01106.p1 GENE.Phypoly_transcript_01106~~Phypoly_transcript_01106.p1  ORF type:complete len:1211 (+),score=351.28 Phypoly_transcript_01106:507-3635(+)